MDYEYVCTTLCVCSSAVEKEIEEWMGSYAVFMGLGVDSGGVTW